MSQVEVDYRDCDRQIWEEELADFIPSRMLDAHIHCIWDSNYPEGPPDRKGPQNLRDGDHDLAALNRCAATLYPGRQMQYLILGTPSKGIDVARHTESVRQEIADVPGLRHTRLVTPQCKLSDIERDVQDPKFIGLKPYRTYSVTGDIAQCRIHEFLPHEQMELANQHSLWVTMHLSRFDGCADQHNLDDLEEYTTKRYPNIRWQLAHCARSFTYWPIRQAIDRLRHMPNIHYDTSAVTDVRPYITFLTKEDTKRVFWGSDGVGAAFFHGFYAALGRAWQHYDADAGGLQFPHCDGRPILAVYEQLMSLKCACEIAGLSSEQIEGIFWRNAATAFGISEDEGVANGQVN